MKILVTGSRKTGTPSVIWEALEDIQPTLVITGGGRGADHYAQQWCKRHGIPNKVFLPEWHKLGKRAGPIRNQLMVNENPDTVLAFLCHELPCRGTKDTILKAERADIPVEIRRVWQTNKEMHDYQDQLSKT